MKESTSLRFFLYSAPVSQENKLYLRIVVDRKKTEVCLGHIIDLKTWDDERQRSTKDKRLNEELSFFENKIFGIKRDLTYSGR